MAYKAGTKRYFIFIYEVYSYWGFILATKKRTFSLSIWVWIKIDKVLVLFVIWFNFLADQTLRHTLSNLLHHFIPLKLLFQVLIYLRSSRGNRLNNEHLKVLPFESPFGHTKPIARSKRSVCMDNQSSFIHPLFIFWMFVIKGQFFDFFNLLYQQRLELQGHHLCLNIR